MAEPTVEVQIKARADALDAGLKQAEQKVRAFQAKFQTPSLIENVATGVIGFGAITTAVNLATASVKAMKGEWEGVEHIIRKLPGGIGKAIGSVIDLGRELNGTAEAAQKAEEIEKRRLDRLQKVRDLEKEIAKYSGQRNSGVDRDRIIQAGVAGGLTDQQASAESQRAMALAEIGRERDRMIAEAERASGGSQYKLDWLTKDINDAASKQTAIANEAADRLRNQADVQLLRDRQVVINAERKKQEAEAKNIDRLERLVRASALEAVGDTLGAKLERIGANYAGQIEGASPGSRSLLRQLEGQERARAMMEDQVARREEARKKASAAFDQGEQVRAQAEGLVNRRMDILANQRLAASDAGMLTRSAGTDKSIELAAKSVQIEQEIARILKDSADRERRKDAFVSKQLVGF